MSAKNKLIVTGIEAMLDRHKEEIAEEFGVHGSPASRDVTVPKMKEEKRAAKEKSNEDM
ncbi:MAG TPA: hypothetical protein VFK44_13085 [Bacillales bacterium]|nr:hypothetical protein [Bacillales bacterium]